MRKVENDGLVGVVSCLVYVASFAVGATVGFSLAPEIIRGLAPEELLTPPPVEWFVRLAGAVVLGFLAIAGAGAVKYLSLRGQK